MTDPTRTTENATNIFDDQQLDTNTSSTIPLHFTVMSQNAVISTITYSVIFIIAAAGNFSVFFAVTHRTKSRISTLILHLSIADLLVTFGVIPLEIIWRITVQWYGGNLVCKLCKVFSAFGLYLSSAVLICISLDRYFAIVHPLKLRREKVMLAAAWVVAIVCSIPQSFIFRVEHHPQYPTVHQCVSMLYYSKELELIYNLFSVSVMYFVPLIVIIFTYGMILCKMSRKSRQEDESRSDIGEASGRILLRRNDATNRMERAKSRTLRLTFVIVVVFVFCWTPYVVMTLWYMLDRESAEKVDGRVQDALFIMAVANSCVNPLVYGSFSKECRMSNCCSRVRRRRHENHKIVYSASRRTTCKAGPKEDQHFDFKSEASRMGSPTPSTKTDKLSPALNNVKSPMPSIPSTKLSSENARPPRTITVRVPTTKIVNNKLVIESSFHEMKDFYSKPKTTNSLNHYN